METSTRYSRQMLFAPIGVKGQEQLGQKKVAIVGMGALGTVLANHMVRAGVGHVRLIDRDFVEASNLQRQMLYDEQDAAQHLPKAVAAAAKLRAINSGVRVEAFVADLHANNAESLLADADLLLDGTDNFQVRYLLNDVAVKHQIPWIYGGAVRARGMCAVIRPGITPCFRCLFPHSPAGRTETCDTVGVIGPIIHVIASYQAAEALKLLVGATESLNPNLEQIDLWDNDSLSIPIAEGRNPACPACVMGQFEYLEMRSAETEEFATLCGRDTVQISPGKPQSVDLPRLAQELKKLGDVEQNRFLLRFHTGEHTLVFFQDGRVLVQGTPDIATARTLYARYVGH